ncbi:MAG: TetR family transcriptional regulator [Proteobacteria bacterium]|nr:MAG: TetR family transcriptional regulator [Pseudomonadota bacterium]PIE68172.1 MAG: TetR family transcriptional regulator [Deltaproteobacteria bacterium]
MKATIKAVAIELFFQKGYYATSIAEIAQGCGIQKSSIYYHYPSKEELLFHILRTTMDNLTAHLKENLAVDAEVTEQLKRAVRGHVRFHLEHQKETFIASSELRGLTREHYQIIVGKRDKYEQIFQQLIRTGRQKGFFTQADSKIISYAILTLCTAGASWFKPDGRLSVNQIAAIYEDFVLSGLQHSP